MDTRLAHIIVVTCEMALKRVRSKTKKNKAFEKLSACLGMLDKLMDSFGSDHSN